MCHRNIFCVDKASRLPVAMWLQAACILATASAVCDASVTGHCASQNTEAFAEETAFVQLASQFHAAEQRSGHVEAGLGGLDNDLARPDPTLPPMMPLLKAMLADMVRNVTGQFVAQKDALCNSIRGGVTDPMAVWLRIMMKSCMNATGSMQAGATLAAQTLEKAVNVSVGYGDIEYVLKGVDALFGEVVVNVTNRVNSLIFQVERIRGNFTQTMDEMGLHDLAEQVSDVQLNRTSDLALKALKTLEEATLGLGDETVPAAKKVVGFCRENIDTWIKSIDELTAMAESSLQGLVNMLQGSFLPMIDRTPPGCRGDLPSAIRDADRTVTKTAQDLRQANINFTDGLKRVLVILTDNLEGITKALAKEHGPELQTASLAVPEAP
mmetsp:Transcript_134387/g.268214  ORF Transcript_134387/g.268214 Transcript_134387/m.268214 type:complete len:382 (-) Transcript_134387:104-1249(-)